MFHTPRFSWGDKYLLSGCGFLRARAHARGTGRAVQLARAMVNITLANMANCSLCFQAVPSDRRRIKRLYGASCASARATLEKLSPDGFQMLMTMSGPDAVLCSGCGKKLTSVESLETKLVTAKKAVTDLLGCLQREVESRSSAISLVPPAKRPCQCLGRPPAVYSLAYLYQELFHTP